MTTPKKTIEVNLKVCQVVVSCHDGSVFEFTVTGLLNWLKAKDPGYRGYQADGVVIDPDDRVFDQLGAKFLLFHRADGQDCGKVLIAKEDIAKIEFSPLQPHWHQVTVPSSVRVGIIHGGQYLLLEERIRVLRQDPEPEAKPWWKFWA